MGMDVEGAARYNGRMLKIVQLAIVIYVTWFLLYGGTQVTTTNPLAAGFVGWLCAFLFTWAWMVIRSSFAGLAGAGKRHH